MAHGSSPERLQVLGRRQAALPGDGDHDVRVLWQTIVQVSGHREDGAIEFHITGRCYAFRRERRSVFSKHRARILIHLRLQDDGYLIHGGLR